MAARTDGRSVAVVLALLSEPCPRVCEMCIRVRHMWEEAVCYLTGEKVQFGDYGKIEEYFIGNTNYAADQF